MIDMQTNFITVIDFDVAAHSDWCNFDRCGTKLFWSPELLEMSGPYTRTVDVYAFGKTILDILSIDEKALKGEVEWTFFIRSICLSKYKNFRENAYYDELFATAEENEEFFQAQRAPQIKYKE